jgi:hypothetical protein
MQEVGTETLEQRHGAEMAYRRCFSVLVLVLLLCSGRCWVGVKLLAPAAAAVPAVV